MISVIKFSIYGRKIMANKKEENLRLNLLARSISILEKTKFNFKNYEEERHTLLDFTEEASPNYPLWEHMIKGFEAVIELDNKLKLEKEDFLYLSELSANLKEQRIRESFEPGKIYIFQLYNKFNEVLQFLTRASADNYIKAHPDDFNNIIIGITESKNIDLKLLLTIIERNF